MATRFMRVDLSADARDFEAAIIEQGIPLLDKSNASYRVLQKWLGRLVAEPEWKGDSVDFYVCDDEKARLNDVRCEPATTEDLRRSRELKQDLDELAKRLQQITPDERQFALHSALVRHFQKLTAESSPAQAQGGCYFFKYRDGNVWRLVWAWGYQRKDLAPSSPSICTNPSCGLLFARRSDGSRSCPACEKTIQQPPTTPRRPRWRRIAMIAAMLLLAVGVGWVLRGWFRRPALPNGRDLGLQATPKQWTGHVGGQVRYEVVLYEEDKQEDVTAQVTCVAENPRILRFDRFGSRATARSPGRTPVHFYLEDKESRATVQILPPVPPDTITVEPSEVTLGVGTTEQLRVAGEFADVENEVDLTEAAEWKVADAGFVHCDAGRLEGKAAGETTVIARYRATPNDDYVERQVRVTVIDESYQKLELAVRPTSFSERKAAELEARVVTDSGVKRSVLNSSELEFDVDPPQVALVEGDYLRAVRAGKGTLKASFRDLTATSDFQVEKDVSVAIFEVRPNPLDLVIGETFELQVVSSSSDPIRLISSDSQVAEVLPPMRVVGRAPGKAKVTVRQEAREATIDVEVKAAAIESVRFVPDRCSVPVDGSKTLRLVGLCEEGQEVDLTPDRIVWEELPAATFVEFDVDTLEVRGRLPTDVSPQTLVARWGELKAEATIDVTAPPVKVELTPSGEIELPKGQVSRLHAWASYGGGHRVEIPPERLQWKLDPEEVSGLELDRGLGAVRATAPGVGPLNVRALYQGYESNSVAFRSTDATTTFELSNDRSLIVVGDTGQFRVSLPQPTSPVEVRRIDDEPAPGGEASDVFLEGVSFESADPLVLAVSEHSGAYRALAPGIVTVTAKHEKTGASALLEIEVVDWEKVNLVLRPAEVKLIVGARESLELFVSDGGREEKIPWTSDVDDVRLGIARPEAVQWNPPELVGVSPAEPFQVTASYGGKTARSVVQVLPPPAPDESMIRIVPAMASLAPGQVLSPQVERQVPGAGDRWVELDPLTVQWTVPDSIRWTPPSAELRPQLTPSESAKGTVELEAEHAGLKATLRIEIESKTPPVGILTVAREPEGEYLPEGREQRYTVMVGEGAQAQPAVGVRWPPAFENDYVRWEPPVLFAKKRGHEQRLHAIVGSRRASFSTRTVAPPEEDVPVELPKRADEVRIVSDQSMPITMPVGARFGDFRVEAISPDLPPSNVTREATLRFENISSQEPPLAVEQGRVVALRPGSATVFAEYNGTRSATGLRFNVDNDVQISGIEVVPAVNQLRVGENVELLANGFTGVGSARRSIGEITRLGNLTWESDKPDVVQVNGSNITALEPGQATVTVSAEDASGTAQVTVDAPGTQVVQSYLRPRQLRLRVGETRWLGTDVTLMRGDSDVSDQMQVVSTAPTIVRYNPDNRSIEGVSAGRAELHIAADDDRFRLPVVVESGPPLAEGTIVIEPNSGTLAEGERQQLRVLLVTDSDRVDRTSSALLTSKEPGILAVNGSQIRGIQAGTAQIEARLPGIDDPGSASFTVVKGQFDQLYVVPASMRLQVGESRKFRVIARGPNGQRDVSGHADLQVAAGGENPAAIELSGSNNVRGVVPGSASIQVSWGDLAASPVPVIVSDDPITALSIAPSETTIGVGDLARYRVFVRQGNRQRPLSDVDGVKLHIADASIAAARRNLGARGINEGTTAVTAIYGRHRATAQLHVTNARPTGPPIPWNGLRFDPDVLTLQLGVTGTSVRVLKVNSRGEIEDVDHEVNIKIEDTNISTVKWTASGPVFEPKREGQTTATATEDPEKLPPGQVPLTTRQPLLIHIVEPEELPLQDRLEASPNPIRLAVGKPADFGRVQVIPGNNAQPIDVDYQVQSSDESIVTVHDGKTLRGEEAGRTYVTVRPNVPGNRYKELSTNVAVYVEAEPATDDPDADKPCRRLLLTGPSQTTVGAEPQYCVEGVFEGGGRSDVTSRGASLVLDRGQESLAEVQPGCSLVARRPGTVKVQARYRDRVSNAVPLRIEPVAPSFERIALEMAERPFVVGESRAYRLWGYPPGRRPRQELTGLVGTDAVVATKVVEPSGDESIVSHDAPRLVARAPGRFLVGARYAGLTAKPLDVEIKGAPKNLQLRAEPPAITLRLGQHTPRLEAVARSPQAPDEWCVDAQWSSENETIVAPGPEVKGQFVGKALGQTRLKATYGELEAFVKVTVAGDPFQRVTLRKQPEWQPGNRFAVIVDIKADGMGAEGLEYRIFPVGNPEGGQWKTASNSGGDAKIQLTGPSLRAGPPDTVYHLLIEARSGKQKTAERCPLSFGLTERTIHQHAEVKPEG